MQRGIQSGLDHYVSSVSSLYFDSWLTCSDVTEWFLLFTTFSVHLTFSANRSNAVLTENLYLFQSKFPTITPTTTKINLTYILSHSRAATLTQYVVGGVFKALES